MLLQQIGDEHLHLDAGVLRRQIREARPAAELIELQGRQLPRAVGLRRGHLGVQQAAPLPQRLLFPQGVRHAPMLLPFRLTLALLHLPELALFLLPGRRFLLPGRVICHHAAHVGDEYPSHVKGDRASKDREFQRENSENSERRQGSGKKHVHASYLRIRHAVPPLSILPLFL